MLNENVGPVCVEGDGRGGEWEAGRKGGVRWTGGGRGGAGSRRNREKLCSIAQYFAMKTEQRG